MYPVAQHVGELEAELERVKVRVKRLEDAPPVILVVSTAELDGLSKTSGHTSDECLRALCKFNGSMAEALEHLQSLPLVE